MLSVGVDKYHQMTDDDTEQTRQSEQSVGEAL